MSKLLSIILLALSACCMQPPHVIKVTRIKIGASPEVAGGLGKSGRVEIGQATAKEGGCEFRIKADRLIEILDRSIILGPLPIDVTTVDKGDWKFRLRLID